MNEKSHLGNCVGLHPDNVNWDNFLENRCQHLDSHNGWDMYNVMNCFYFVDPSGFIKRHYGYHAKQLWNKFKSEKVIHEL